MIPLFQNCGQFTSKNADQADNPTLQTLASLHDRINQNLKLTCATHSECVVAPAGDRPCGGPSRYYIYSTAATNVSLVNSLINEYTALEQTYNLDNDVYGTCEAITAPLASCLANICTRQ